MATTSARTAIGPVTVAAFEQYEEQPLLRDELAPRILPSRVSRAMLRSARLAPARKALIAVAERQLPGVWGSLLCRKRFVSEVVNHGLADGIRTVVVLGAGFDTLGCRLAHQRRYPDLKVFEVDQPVNVEAKRRAIERVWGSLPDGVVQVPAKFGSDDVAAALAARRFRIRRPAIFVWEAVSQYLSADAVRRTLDFLAQAAPGSRLVFTFIRSDFLDGSARCGADVARRRFVDTGLWKFGWQPDDIPGVLAEHGWRQCEQLGPEDYVRRYLAPAGRTLTVSPIERAVSAVRTDLER